MRIALAEPSRTVRRIVTGMLEAWDHEVCPHADAGETLACLRSDHNIRALIASAELASTSGVQLVADARVLAGAERPLYIILMSSIDERAMMVKALDNGADDFISKPPAAEELRARLRAAERLTAMQAELIQLATTDSLTELLTRRAFFKSAETMMRRTEQGHPLSVLICDIDRFKIINDTYGHDVGDLVLRAVSAQAKSVSGPVGRLGGEEFAFLLEARLEDAISIAEHFRQLVGELAVRAGNTNVSVTCSIGVAERCPGDTIDALLRRADLSLYEAKQSGRNRVIADAFPSRKDHEQWCDVARLGAAEPTTK